MIKPCTLTFGLLWVQNWHLALLWEYLLAIVGVQVTVM